MVVFAHSAIVRNFSNDIDKKGNLTRALYLGLGLLTLLTTILFCGISRDSEFYEPTIFVKHRPTFKIHFYTPTAESDMTLSDLSEEGKKEELLYQEFVEGQKVYADNSNRLWFLPHILIQLTLTFFSFGIARQNAIKLKRLLIHYLINLIPSTVIVGLMLFNEKPWQLFVLTMIVLVINVGTIRFTQRKSSAQQRL
jgi:hypothetical protein